MPWTPKQIRTAAIAARNAGWNDDQRRMVLSRLGNRAIHQGKISSKSPKLRNDDFEQFMATAEASAGGELPGYRMGYWYEKAGDSIHRQRHIIERLVEQLDIEPALLGGMISRATGGRASSLEDLDQLNNRGIAGKVIDLLRYKLKHQPQPTHQVQHEPDTEEVAIPF